MFVKTDENGRITATSEKIEYLGEGAFALDFPEGFDFSTIGDYVVENGELVNEPAPVPAWAQIEELKTKLSQTDYIATKAADALVRGEGLEEIQAKYGDIIEARENWREKINELEGSS